jgi:hypothetical protein
MSNSKPDASEFLPLPFFPYEERPRSSPIDVEEAATALFLAHGNVGDAARRLRVTRARLQRAIRASPRLIRLQARLNDVPESDDECTTATSSQSMRASAQTGGARR